MSVFWGITSYFNPAGYTGKVSHFRRFRLASRQQGLRLAAVELVFNENHPELADDDADLRIVVRGDESNLMWQKEALLNIALKHLPDDCRYVAWLDADVLFAEPDWIVRTQRLLEVFPVVQPFSHFVQLPPQGTTLTDQVAAGSAAPKPQESFGYGVSRYGATCREPFGRTGNAWAARRELLDQCGFYDRLILGDADSFMAYALVDCRPFLSRNADCFPTQLIADYEMWASQVFEKVKGKVGCVPGRLLHLWHGSVENRGYAKRRAILKRHAYHPRRDVAIAPNGLLYWTRDDREFRADVLDYFRYRREDDIDVTMSRSKHVLITGMSGVVGGVVGRELVKRYRVRALSRSPIEGVETMFADIRDAEAMEPAFNGIHTVVHFAAYSAADGVRQIDVNIRGSYNLFEAAARAGVKRVVYISSGATQQAYESEEPYLSLVEGRLSDVPSHVHMLSDTDAVRPTRMYGVAKACVETMGRMYAETSRLSVLCLRLGRIHRDDRPRSCRDAAVHLSHRDVVQLVEKSIEAPETLRFGIYYGVSDNRTRFRDLSSAFKDLGFVPQDGAEAWQPSNDVSEPE